MVKFFETITFYLGFEESSKQLDAMLQTRNKPIKSWFPLWKRMTIDSIKQGRKKN
jgi:hypothetical protein